VTWGFVANEGNIETMPDSFIPRFFGGRCADVDLLGPGLTINIA
jgi:hypothetical protein